VEQPDRGREEHLQMRAKLVAQGYPMDHQVLAGPHRRAQRHRRRRVRNQRPEPGPVGAQGVGQDERVEPVVLVARRAVAATQMLDLLRADHHHREPGLEQPIDDLAVRALDRHLRHPDCSQPAHQLPQASRRVRHGEPVDLTARVVDD